jgi:hypothetical protein
MNGATGGAPIPEVSNSPNYSRTRKIPKKKNKKQLPEANTNSYRQPFMITSHKEGKNKSPPMNSMQILDPKAMHAS